MSGQHQPKGSMCMGCSNGSAECAQLPFSTMPVIKSYPDGVKAVKCAGQQPTRAERDRPAANLANEETWFARFREQAIRADQPRLFIHCGAR